MLSSSPTSPSDVNELASFIGQIVREQSQLGRRVDGSFLAHLVRTKYPQLEYERLGIKRLGDAVEVALSKGLVIRNWDVKHLELSPSNGAPLQDIEGRHYVRSDVWRAFVLIPDRVTYLEKKSYRIVEPTFGGNPYADDPEFVRVNALTEEQQSSWAVLFLKQQPIVGEMNTVIAELVRRGGRTFAAPVTRAWVKLRSARIVDHIKEWANQNQLDASKLLLPAEPRERGASRKTAANDDAWRAAVLAVVEEMTLDELDALVLPVSVKSLKRHFSPK